VPYRFVFFSRIASSPVEETESRLAPGIPSGPRLGLPTRAVKISAGRSPHAAL
jgi:hypothetical protein